jgi:predicted dehydrogenase
MEKVNLAVIGYGNMGISHCRNVNDKKVRNCTLYAICDNNVDKLKLAKETYGDTVKYFDNTKALFEDEQVDAVLVATPHYDHPVLAIEAFKHNKHVLIEKPAGVYTKAVREANEAALKTDRVFGIMYNQRTNPVYQKVREMVQSGELGEIKRVIWIINDWYRSQSYYNSGGWRATWSGEGGGVLLNQCPHNLDLWQWICGMPSRVRSQMYFGKYHDIEVEDDVTTFAEYSNGATGVFVTSTHETPGTNRLEIFCDMGKLVVENDQIVFYRTVVGEREFNKTYTKGFGQPDCWRCEVPPAKGAYTQHVGIIQNFTDAILKGTPLLAPGIDGIKGLLISNAMHLSAWTDNWVEVEKIDEQMFINILNQKIASSTNKKDVSQNVTLDVAGTH